jgi:hypothetical protein
MSKTTDTPAAPDVIGKALSARRPRRPQRMAREPMAPAEPPALAPVPEPARQPNPAARTPSKIAQVLALLRRAEGATLAELVEATGWLPHTTRAALTGLRKKGHVLLGDKRGEVTCYRIAEAGE